MRTAHFKRYMVQERRWHCSKGLWGWVLQSAVCTGQGVLCAGTRRHCQSILVPPGAFSSWKWLGEGNINWMRKVLGYARLPEGRKLGRRRPRRSKIPVPARSCTDRTWANCWRLSREQLLMKRAKDLPGLQRVGVTLGPDQPEVRHGQYFRLLNEVHKVGT